MRRSVDQILVLTESATAVALSVLLGNLRLLELPNGGSIAFATLPLLALAATRGLRIGLLAGCSAGAAHALAGGTIIHPAQLALDYVGAYALLATVSLGAGTSVTRLRLATAFAMTCHLAVMTVSGMVFFAPLVGIDGARPALLYSLGYNALTVVPETVLALLLLPTLVRAVARANPADSWRRGLLAPPAPSRRPHPRAAPLPALPRPAPHLAARSAPAAAARAPAPASPRRLVRPAPFSSSAPWSSARSAAPDAVS